MRARGNEPAREVWLSRLIKISKNTIMQMILSWSSSRGWNAYVQQDQYIGISQQCPKRFKTLLSDAIPFYNTVNVLYINTPSNFNFPSDLVEAAHPTG